MSQVVRKNILTGSQENLFMSDEEPSEEDLIKSQITQGYLNKWTNLLHGWQARFFVLRDGTLSYYRSPDELSIGCRGSIHLKNVTLKPHEYDDCRFEVRVGDSIWYLRGSNQEERTCWIQAIELHRISESGYCSSEPSAILTRRGSLMSLNSTTLSIASASSFHRGHHLKEKLAEMETFKDILCKQVDSLQSYFDACSAIVSHSAHSNIENYFQDIDDLPHTEDSDLERQSSFSHSSAGDQSLHQLNPPGESGHEEDNHEDNAEETEVPPINDTQPETQPKKIEINPPSQPTRGFLSRFFPFRSNTGSVVVQPGIPEENSSTPELPEQYQPWSRFADLKKILEQHGSHAPDFKGESYTFKATTVGILTNLSYCIELMQQREDQWKKRVEREIEKRKRAEEAYRSLIHERDKLRDDVNRSKLMVLGGPDLEEGPDCSINEEEFFDAVDAQLDKLASFDERREALRSILPSLHNQSGPMPASHPLYEEVNRVVADRLHLCNPSSLNFSESDGWNLIAEDGDMMIYRREMEDSKGFVLDPLQAIHTVEGVTARELCNYFWDVQYRMDWETTIDEPPTVMEICGSDTVLLYQIYKRVWPSTQRDGLFYSHIRQVETCERAENAADMWMVLNYSTDYSAGNSPAADANTSGNCLIRIFADVVLICQTILPPEVSLEDLKNSKVGRSSIKTRLLYAATINPGGWAPAAVLRAVAKREYPRFIKRFSQYVKTKTQNLPLLV